ncbi:DNA polymerase IV [Geobacter sp. FeAm09]|uniref:DNA polymerase IV n=1 Tax=Geobacter sp. FeAm09 TaxID=2597769 RepID=UPI0011F088BF|nr:DNA polymerase IV [Geobacter sp. FeAm09]QEM70016.1 DNA polymerase IV [Geobacter sp. FeAm09]
MEPRIILHIDMDAFFASVEQQANADLRGKPVAVTGAGHRTVVTTSSYEARAFGVKTGMAVWEAKRCCPHLIVVTGNNRNYTRISREIMGIMQDYTPEVEVFSIDEAFMDVTHSLSIFGSAEKIAGQIKARIREAFGITCSIGIAPNKLLAKLASDMHKPDGLTAIAPADVPRVMEHLPIGALCGVGKKMRRHLNLMGIATCGQLGRCDEARLTRRFGVVGSHLKRMGRGLDDSPVVPCGEEDEVKSVSHSMTLERDIEARDDILRFLLQLSHMVGSRARRYNVAGKTVGLYVRYADFFTSFGRQATLPGYVSLSDDIYRAVLSILDSVELEQPVRLLGVRLTNLKHQSEQLPLFENERKRVAAARAVDDLNRRFGSLVVTFGTLLPAGESGGSHVISPAWRPSGIRNVEVT